jgi:hypothetical protein
LLRGSGVPLHPLVEGVRQESMEALERTLGALAKQEPSNRNNAAVGK